MPYNGKLDKPPTINHLIAAQQEPYKKASLNKTKKQQQKTGKFSGGKNAEKNAKTKKATEPSRKIRQEIGKGN